jgi:uncharacterized protein (TIGR00730 family)
MQHYQATTHHNADTTLRLSRELTQIMKQLIEGFTQLADVSPAVTIFGSARTPENSSDYHFAEMLGKQLSELGFAVLTGGGPGVMAAANKGAYHAKSLSVGLNISLPHEQKSNLYQNISIDCEDFFVRKALFIKYSSAFVVLPGGLGTLDELGEILVLAQTEKMPRVPIILVNSEFWAGLIEWMKTVLIAKNTIDSNDLNLFHVVDEVEAVIKIIMDAATEDSPDNESLA